MQVQPVTISQYAATFSGRGLISHYLILGLISQHRPDYSRVFVSDRHGRRCHRQDMKTSIINGSEVFRLSVAIQM